MDKLLLIYNLNLKISKLKVIGKCNKCRGKVFNINI